MIGVQDLCDYLHIDYADRAVLANVERALASARGRLRGAIGDRAEQVFIADGRADDLMLIYAAEAYDHRADTAAGKVASARSHLITDTETQLRQEYMRAIGEVDV